MYLKMCQVLGNLVVETNRNNASFIELRCHILDFLPSLWSSSSVVFLAFIWSLLCLLCLIFFLFRNHSICSRHVFEKIYEEKGQTTEKRESKVHPSILCTSLLWLQKYLFCTFCDGGEISLSCPRISARMQGQGAVSFSSHVKSTSGASFSCEVHICLICLFPSYLVLTFRLSFHFSKIISSHSS